MAREIIYGPMSILVVGFDGNKMTQKLKPQLDELRKKHVIRLVDALMVKKDNNGAVTTQQATDFSGKEKERFGSIVGGLIGFGYAGAAGAEVGVEQGALTMSSNDYGLSESEIKDLTDDVPANSSAFIAILEHVWAKKLKQEIVNSGGRLLAHGFVQPAALVSYGMALRELDESMPA